MRSPIQDCLEIVRVFAATERKLTAPEVKMLEVAADVVEKHLNGLDEVAELKKERAELVSVRSGINRAIGVEVSGLVMIISEMPITVEKKHLISVQIEKILGEIK